MECFTFEMILKFSNWFNFVWAHDDISFKKQCLWFKNMLLLKKKGDELIGKWSLD